MSKGKGGASVRYAVVLGVTVVILGVIGLGLWLRDPGLFGIGWGLEKSGATVLQGRRFLLKGPP